MADGYDKLNNFLRTYCPNTRCCECHFRKSNRCTHPMRPRVKLLQHKLKRGGNKFKR